MKKEEKEAIEQLKSWREYIAKYRDSVNKANDIEFYLRTVLNLIETQKAEIEELNRENERQHELLCNIHNKNEQEKVDLRLQYIAEIKKKDKTINLMAEQLTSPINSKEWVIEYYTKLAEEEK